MEDGGRGGGGGDVETGGGRKPAAAAVYTTALWPTPLSRVTALRPLTVTSELQLVGGSS